MAEFNLRDPDLERIEITIKPDTLDYYMDVHIVQLSHLREVLVDIVNRIDNGEIKAGSEQPDLNVYPVDDDGTDPLS